MDSYQTSPQIEPRPASRPAYLRQAAHPLSRHRSDMLTAYGQTRPMGMPTYLPSTTKTGP